MKSTILLHAIILAILCFVTMTANSDSLMRNLMEPVTVPFVDLDKYLGTWYEQASIPFFPQLGCTQTVATYSWNPDKLSVRVDNSCIKKGKLSQSIGKATP
jgi:lipocalin